MAGYHARTDIAQRAKNHDAALMVSQSAAAAVRPAVSACIPRDHPCRVQRLARLAWLLLTLV